MYTFNATDAKEGKLMPNGEYECCIEKVEFKQTKTSGRKKMALQIRVRNDIEQNCKNRVLFDDIWTDKDTNTIFDSKKINRIMATQDIADGKEWKTIQDVANDMVGINLIAVVAQKHDDYSDKEVNVIQRYKKSEHMPQKLGDGQVEKNIPDDFINEDEIPF